MLRRAHLDPAGEMSFLAKNLPNQNGVDRTVRIVLGALLLGIGWLAPPQGLATVTCRIVGWYPLVTGILGWSPFYAVLGISTRSRKR